MKLLRDKIIYLYFKFALTTPNKVNAIETAIALLACVILGYLSPFFILIFKLTTVSYNKIIFYPYFGTIVYLNYYLTAKYFKMNINDAIESIENYNVIKNHEKYLIFFFSFFSFFFFIGTLLLLRLYNIL